MRRRAVVFDLFNTLVPGTYRGDGDDTPATARIAAALGVDAEAFRTAFHGTNRERHTGAFGDLAGTMRAIARRAGGSPSDEQVELACDVRRGMVAELLAAVPDTTLSTLEDLRAAGWRIGLASNVTPGASVQWRDSRLPPYFHAVAFSDEVAVAKPDPGIYLHVCRALEVPPDRCVFVGDGADTELVGATAVGMYAIRTTEHADTDPSWTSPTIASLIELPALLTELPGLSGQAASASVSASAVDGGEVPGMRRTGDQPAGRVG